jgi:hypothetical protein
MSFDKAIKHKKVKRKKYFGSKAIDSSCRPGGSCPYCKSNRQHKHKKKIKSKDDQIKEFIQFNKDWLKLQQLQDEMILQLNKFIEGYE